MGKSEIVTGLDIGTTKVCALIAEVSESGEPTLIGAGSSVSRGLRRGVVVDIESTTRAIEEAVTKAATQANREVDSVYVGVTGDHIASLNSSGIVPITRPDREITREDVERVNEQARVIVLPPDRQILHAIPRAYSVDGQGGVRQPVGMSGTRLEVQTHIVHGAVTFLQNVEKCVVKAGLEVADAVLEPIASGEAVLLPTERELGVCLVDIGGGTSDIAVFYGGEIYYSAVVPVGGNHITNDIAEGLKVGQPEAERLKVQHGSALTDMVQEDEVISVHQVGRDEARKLRRRAMAQIIEPRMQELFELVRHELSEGDCLNRIPFGLVISGGGSQLRNVVEVAQQVMGLPCRIGRPSGIAGLSDALTHPMYATAVGLVLYGAHQVAAGRHPGGGGVNLGRLKSLTPLMKWWARLREILGI
ncbi:MAG TPA: cell division protein FtsA [Chthonomonadaceae bacterium]|nr:cell division protein FtsA [Chthonomonadaceae bacterium]